MKRPMFRIATTSIGLVIIAALLVWGCKTLQPEPEAKVTTPGGASIEEAQSAPYDGPLARIAVSRFTDKTGKGWGARAGREEGGMERRSEGEKEREGGRANVRRCEGANGATVLSDFKSKV